MQGKDYEMISSIQADVLGYLQEHPNAADSLDGIRQWWLTRQLARRSTIRVQKALDELVEAQLIDCRTMNDGRLVYSKVGDRPHGRNRAKTRESDRNP